MKKLLCIIFLSFLFVASLLMSTACSACGPKYKDYDDFKKNGTYKEHQDFYDWCSRNP